MKPASSLIQQDEESIMAKVMMLADEMMTKGSPTFRPYAEQMVALHLQRKLGIPDAAITAEVIYAFVRKLGPNLITKLDGIGPAGAKKLMEAARAAKAEKQPTPQ